MEKHWGTTSSRIYLSVFHMAVAERIPFLGHSVVLGMDPGQLVQMGGICAPAHLHPLPKIPEPCSVSGDKESLSLKSG